MYKLFTIEEATRLIPVVDRTVGEMQEAVRDMSELQKRLLGSEPADVRTNHLAQEIAFLLSVVHQNKADLDRLGVHLKDVESGLVDFPSQLGAEVICLTWERGQDAITHYHRLSGDTKPQPLPQAEGGAARA